MGYGLAGLHGTPHLQGDGDLEAGHPFTLALSNARELAPGFLIAGLQDWSLPFKGGVLVPSLDFLLPLVTDATGSFTLSSLWPPGIPEVTTAYFQCWIIDAAGPQGFAASNALAGTTPPP
jgi:hypothetical protein